ncbi:MAG: hypothetical protein JSU63_02380 [Phycisphaerales bacterium]|nr:MAG: hypothetical protein JSU63_02380 [Phycisphaerales bacterium]
MVDQDAPRPFNGPEQPAGSSRAIGLFDQEDASPARLSWGKKVVFTLIVLTLVLGGLEVACRLLGLGGGEAVAHYVSDWHGTPDGRSFWVVRGQGYNADGMRDREHEIQKPPGVVRLVCLGDSVTAGHGVKRSQAYPYIFESFLQQLGLPAEVFNIAASGWSTQQEATAYQVVARRYRPDHVFLGFCLNDVAEMHNNLTAPPPAAVSFFVRRSALVRWIIDAEGRQVSSVEDLFTKPDSPAVKDGWERVFSELGVLKEQTAADGCDFSVLVFPFRLQLEPDAPQPIAQQVLFEFCLRNGIPCLDLLPALSKVGPSAFIDESHFSQEGARIVAEELVRWGRSGCMMCGYDLSGVTSDTCPRCGQTIAR